MVEIKLGYFVHHVGLYIDFIILGFFKDPFSKYRKFNIPPELVQKSLGVIPAIVVGWTCRLGKTLLHFLVPGSCGNSRQFLLLNRDLNVQHVMVA